MRISIVTVCRNSVATIRDAVASVLSQKGVDFEYLIIDGASTDGTPDVIREFEKGAYAHSFKCISEPDHGMYDALNKGIRLATGDVIGILHADDVFATDDTLFKITSLWKETEAKRGILDAIYGDIRFVRDTRLRTDVHNSATILQSLTTLRSLPTHRYCTGRFFRPWQMRFGVQISHPSFFCRRELFSRLGFYETDMGMYADFELLVRYLAKSRIRATYIPLCTTVMRSGGASTSGLRATCAITKSDRLSLLKNGIWTCTPLLLLRLPFKLLGLFFKKTIRT